MKGVIFKQFEAFVVGGFGEEAFERILEASQFQKGPPFAAPGTYPDADMMALVGTAVRELGIPLADAVRAFGEFLFDGLAASAPSLVRTESGLIDFLERIDSVIHVEVRKLWPDAATPTFSPNLRDDGVLQLQYESSRGLCDLVMGLVTGAAKHFSEEIRIQHVACQKRGDAACLFEVERIGEGRNAA